MMGELIPLFPGDRHAPASEMLAGAPRTGEFTAVEAASLRLLARRAMSRREMEQALTRLEFAEPVIADELDRLESCGLLDDHALAQHLVVRLQESKGLVGSAIRAELVRRVIAPAAIDYAMELVDADDELARASEIAMRRAQQYGALDVSTKERRITAYLLRRGYSSAAVRAAVHVVRSA